MRVQLAHVTKSYGAQVVLDDVTLTIGPRARIGLVGPNGVGKSTLLQIVAGAEAPDRGAVTRAPASVTVLSFFADGHASLRMFNARPTDVAFTGR